MRIEVDRWGQLKTAPEEHKVEKVNTEENFSQVEYELVNVTKDDEEDKGDKKSG